MNGGGPADPDLVTQNNRFIIRVQNGTYPEQVDVEGYITDAAHDIFIINDTGHAPIIAERVNIRNQWVTFQGLSVDGGSGISGISGIDIRSNNIVVRGCKVYNVYTGADHSSGIYAYDDTSEGVYIVGNECYNNSIGIRSRGCQTVIWSNICRDNTRDGNDNSQGIRTGLQGTNIEIAQNRCYGNYEGIRIRGLSDVSRIFNNLVYNNISDGIECEGTGTGKTSRFRVFQNTIYNNGGDGIRLNGETDDVTLVAIFNNLITHNTGYGVNAIGTVTYDDDMGNVNFNNSWNNTAGIHNIPVLSWGSENISADPDYISTTVGNADFLKIQTTSTCIDKGGDSSPYGTWPDDFWGDPRL